jgi:hypothetical protein
MTETSDLPTDPTVGDAEGGSAEELELAGPGAGLSSVDDGEADDAEDDLAGPN